jgi:hypothetical protein
LLKNGLKVGEPGQFQPGSRFGVITEGSLGGWLAQRQAALRDVMAAGARSISCLPTKDRAHRVPQKIFSGNPI